MVEVSLYELVKVNGSRPAWPDEFGRLVEACEADVTDRLPFGVVADWCDEHGEEELGAAFRWLHKRPEIEIRESLPGGKSFYLLQNCPNTVGYISSDTDRGLVGLVVKLSERLAELRRDLA